MPNYSNSKVDLSRKPQNIKQHNQRLVLSLLHFYGALPISELSERTGLSKTTISNILSYFGKLNIVISDEKGNSTAIGGKRPDLFKINPTLGYTIVLSLFQTDRILCSITDLNHQTIYNNTHGIELDCSYNGLIHHISQAIIIALESMKIKSEQLFGIALACNGILNTDTGVWLYPTISSLGTNLQLRDDLKNVLPFDVELFIDTPHRFAANAELLFEENRKVGPIFVISTKYNMAAANIIYNQKLMPGDNGVVGDFGHIIIDPSYPEQCFCGRNGCLISVVSGKSLFGEVVKKMQKFPSSPVTSDFFSNQLSIKKIFTYANKGDEFAQIIIDYIVNCFAILIHNLLSTNNSKRLILQGFFAAEGNYFIEHLREEVLHFNKFDLRGDVEIEYSMLDLLSDFIEKEAYLLGASLAVSNNYLHRLIIN